jgi:hypothetical protein
MVIFTTMSHNFVKQFDGSKVCSCCGDESGKDPDRDCPRPAPALGIILAIPIDYFP